MDDTKREELEKACKRYHKVRVRMAVVDQDASCMVPSSAERMDPTNPPASCPACLKMARTGVPDIASAASLLVATPRGGALAAFPEIASRRFVPAADSGDQDSVGASLSLALRATSSRNFWTIMMA